MTERLPQADALVVEESKIVNYLLNHHHPHGAAKANYFTRFGFKVERWEVLASAMRRHGREREIVERETTCFGVKFVLECDIVTPDGRSPCIQTVWISEQGGPPRLVTAYPSSNR